MCNSTGCGDNTFPSSVTSGGHRQEIGALAASRSPVHLWESVYMCIFHYVHENVLLLLITVDVCLCACVIYMAVPRTPVQSHCEFFHARTWWQIPGSWMCKSNAVNSLTSIRNDTIHTLCSGCNINPSSKGEDLVKCKSVSLQPLLHGCRACTMTLQYNLRQSVEWGTNEKGVLLCCSLSFFSLSTESCDSATR